ncbi:MAG: hypothetical protein RL736_8 [Pseudomonadota bacterium]
MTHNFYKSTPEIYAQVQSCVDTELYSKYIENGSATHVLPVEIEPMSDGLIYIAIKLSICEDPAAEICISQLTQITEDEYMIKLL